MEAVNLPLGLQACSGDQCCARLLEGFLGHGGRSRRRGERRVRLVRKFCLVCDSPFTSFSPPNWVIVSVIPVLIHLRLLTSRLC
jgi:hypothetical protein